MRASTSSSWAAARKRNASPAQVARRRWARPRGCGSARRPSTLLDPMGGESAAAGGAVPHTLPRNQGPSSRPILVVPSRKRGSGFVLLEGMGARTAIVATRAGGIPEVARHDIEAISSRSRPARAGGSDRADACRPGHGRSTPRPGRARPRGGVPLAPWSMLPPALRRDARLPGRTAIAKR